MGRRKDLVNRTQGLANEWAAYFDETEGWAEAGYVTSVLAALVGALLSGPYAREHLARLSSASAQATSQNLAELEKEPS